MNPSHLVLFLALLLSGAGIPGQEPLGPGPKRARTPEDYKPRTLRELVRMESDVESRRGGENPVLARGDVLPSRVRVIYTGSTRPLPQIKKTAIFKWAQLYAGNPDHYTVPYQAEMLFVEERAKYWLAVNERLLPQFEQDLKKGEPLYLYLIQLGGLERMGKWEPLFLVEDFKRLK